MPPILLIGQQPVVCASSSETVCVRSDGGSTFVRSMGGTPRRSARRPSSWFSSKTRFSSRNSVTLRSPWAATWLASASRLISTRPPSSRMRTMRRLKETIPVLLGARQRALEVFDVAAVRQRLFERDLVPADEVAERLVHRLHPQLSAGLDDAVDLVRLVVADQR